MKDLNSEQARSIRKQLKKSACASMISMVHAIQKADEEFADYLKQICIEIADAGLVELFLNLLEHEDESVREIAAEVLRQTRKIRPELLLTRLKHEPEYSDLLLELLALNKKYLKTPLIIRFVFRLGKDNAKRLLNIVVDSAAGVDLKLIGAMQPKIESPDYRLMLVEFLGQVNSASSAAQLCCYLADDFKPVVTQALKKLNQFEARIDTTPMLPYVEDLAEEDLLMALRVIRKNFLPKQIPDLAGLLAGYSDEAREDLMRLVIEMSTEESLEELFNNLAEQEWQGRVKAARLLQQKANKKIYQYARKLADSQIDYVRETGEALLADQRASRPEGVASLNEISKAALHAETEIREPAILSMGMTRNRKALTVFSKVIEIYPESTIAVLKATEQLGFSKGLEVAFRCLKVKNAAYQRQALETISRITTKKHAAKVIRTIRKFIPHLKITVREQAMATEQELLEKYVPTNEQTLDTPSVETSKPNAKTESTHFSTNFNTNSGASGEASTQELKKGDLWMDRYRVEREIGRGAMGRVMLVEDEMVGEKLVLKFMHSALLSDERAKQRFIRELKYSRKISHPNVIRIYEFLSQDNFNAISMEYFESRGIDDYLKKGHRFTVLQSLNILQQVAEGMFAAHEQSVIHRDLKPSNILLNEDGLVKVVDFGIASEITGDDSALTQIGVVVGSPAFLAPERTKQMDADSLSDIYSLGINAYIMLTGKLPYKGDSMSIMYQHADGKARPVNEVNPDIPPEVSDMVRKMIAVDRKKRYQSMLEVSQEIETLKKQITS